MIKIKKKIIGMLVGVMMVSVLVISLANSRDLKSDCNDFDVSETETLSTMEKNHGLTIIEPEKRFYQTSTDYEVVFTAPFDYVDNDTSWDVDPSEKHKWNNISYADDTGLCMLNVSAVNVSKWGKAEAHAVIGGITIASHTYEKPKAEFYFSGNFKMFDDIFLASKTQIRALYSYYEDDEVLGVGVLDEWRQETDSNEYTIDYTENPLSVELDAHRFGKTYTILLYFEAYIEATGGSGTCYIDASNATLERYIQIEKIRLYDACEWSSDLEVLDDCLLDWEEVGPGSVQTGYIKLYNAGPPCSKLDWEIFEWPDWGTWTFDPRVGYDLTPQNGRIVINVSVQAPNQECQSFSGEIKIRNINDESDIETLSVRLTTPIKHTFLRDMQSVRAIFECLNGNTFTLLFARECPQLEKISKMILHYIVYNRWLEN